MADDTKPAVDLGEGERLEKAALPGDWWCNPETPQQILANDERVSYVCCVDGASSNPEMRADRDLIVWLRNNAAALIAAARERDELRVELAELRGQLEMVERERNALRALPKVDYGWGEK